MSRGKEQQRESAAAARRWIDEERPTTTTAEAAHCRGAGPVAVPQRRGRRFEEEPPTTTAAAAHCRCGGAVAVPPRRGRWLDEEPTARTAKAAVTAGRAEWRCRSCAAVAIADCVALGCCPCAVVSLLGLALVKAPLAVGRRCVGRLRRRRRFVLHKKRVRDAAANAAACDRDKGAKADTSSAAAVDDAPASAATVAASAPTPAAPGEAEAWLDEMYRVGHWGFGRVSFSESGNTP
ncbi:unnamed protein product [Urochloa humidicola]